jgi:hypothetical protein
VQLIQALGGGYRPESLLGRDAHRPQSQPDRGGVSPPVDTGAPIPSSTPSRS